MTLCWTRWCFCSLVSLSKQVEYRYGGAGYITYRCLPTGSNLEQQEYQTTLYLLLPFSCPVLSCPVLFCPILIFLSSHHSPPPHFIIFHCPFSFESMVINFIQPSATSNGIQTADGQLSSNDLLSYYSVDGISRWRGMYAKSLIYIVTLGS